MYNEQLPPTQTPPPDLSASPRPKRLRRALNWVKTHRKTSLIIGGVVLIAAASVVTYALVNSQPSDAPVAVKPAPKPKPAPVYYSPLTGVKVEDEAASKKLVTAIMIENSPSARPQSGLKDSGVVFEAIAEAGITRFLVLYQQEKPQLVGPVRSVRLYYVDWLAPFNASVAHIGGSKFALDEVRNGSYRDIDQFFNPGAYWRASDRYAPHNVYTSFERLDALNQEKGFTTSEFTGFIRADSKPAETPTATQINVTMSSLSYNSSYAYDAGSNTYLRSQAGAPHLDREAGQIAPRVVIVMKAQMTRVMEDGWRESVQTTGSGQAYIFQDGTAREVTWHKADRASQLKFTDETGSEVALARGQTWISVVPADTGGVSWQ